MKQDFREFTSRNTTIVVVAPHSAEKVAKFWKEEDLPMIGVPDEEGKLAGLYGQEWKLLKLGRMPALFSSLMVSAAFWQNAALRRWRL